MILYEKRVCAVYNIAQSPSDTLCMFDSINSGVSEDLKDVIIRPSETLKHIGDLVYR